MERLSEEQILKNKEIVEKLFGAMGAGRGGMIDEMFVGIIGDEYFTAPASPRVSWHNCFPGGLCDHSLRVTQFLHRIAKDLAPGRYDANTLNFVGLFHDLGKVGDGVHPYYVPLEGQDNAWRRKKGELYEINKECVHMPTSERGLYLLQKHAITVTSDEYLAIRLNDGMYDETNKRYALHEPDLALLVHFADRWATAVEKS